MKPASPVISKSYPDGYRLPEVVYAKDQPEYLPLPVVKERNGCVTARWKLDWKERIKVLFKGDVYVQILTFNRPLQPSRVTIDPPRISWMNCVDPKDSEKAKEN